MKEIKIDNTRLIIKQVPIKFGITTGVIDLSYEKPFMKYQAALISPINFSKPMSILDFRNVNRKICLPSELRDTEAFILCKGYETYHVEDYNENEASILLGWLWFALREDRLGLAENIVHALKNNNLANRFYETYGLTSEIFIEDLKNRVISSNSKYLNKDFDFERPKIYNGNRYSIVDLVNDLVKYKAEIYINPELIGTYKRISEKTIETHHPLFIDKPTYITDEWFRVVGAVRNSERANLSINYRGKVSVHIPENKDLDVKDETVTLDAMRNFCVIEDGMLNMKKLVVRTNDTGFIKKLKQTGLFRNYLLANNEAIIDLTKIPVISGYGSKFKVPKKMLATAELNYVKSKIINYYIKRKQRNELPEEKTIVVSPKEQYLNKLGIYGKYYFPLKISKSTDKITSSTCKISISSKYSPVQYLKSIDSFIVKGQCKNKFINDTLTDFIKSLNGKGIDSDTIIKNTDEHIYWKNKVCDLKFRIIIGKSLKLYRNKTTADKISGKITQKFNEDNSCSVTWHTN